MQSKRYQVISIRRLELFDDEIDFFKARLIRRRNPVKRDEDSEHDQQPEECQRGQGELDRPTKLFSGRLNLAFLAFATSEGVIEESEGKNEESKDENDSVKRVVSLHHGPLKARSNFDVGGPRFVRSVSVLHERDEKNVDRNYKGRNQGEKERRDRHEGRHVGAFAAPHRSVPQDVDDGEEEADQGADGERNPSCGQNIVWNC